MYIYRKACGYVIAEDFQSFKAFLDVYDPQTHRSENWLNWIAQLDLKTCLACRERHGQIYEADINYYEGRRNMHRLVYSNDGLVFVTYDHYTAFYEVTPPVPSEAEGPDSSETGVTDPSEAGRKGMEKAFDIYPYII